MKITWLPFLLLIVIATAGAMALGFSCDDDDDDDNNPEPVEATCDISATDMTKVEAAFDAEDCLNVGVQFVFDRLMVDTSGTIFRLQGQYAITNENVLYLRGRGVERLCFDRIEGAGVFNVWVETMAPDDDFFVEVVSAMGTDALPFCRINVQAQFAPIDDDTSLDDDTAGDDDTWSTDLCADLYNWLYLVCGLSFYDEDENLIDLDDIIDECEAEDDVWGPQSDIFACLAQNDECEAAAECISDILT
ncbi:MAG: hypothetical protein P9L99_09055 [Candidatus Lernaella stagnicola]|nr:hypothetical protein [Candidatus Lernaella stagnicola]